MHDLKTFVYILQIMQNPKCKYRGTRGESMHNTFGNIAACCDDRMKNYIKTKGIPKL